MAPLELEGDTLGDKHRNYNKLVEEASKNYLVDPPQNDDIKNLLNIDIASKNRNTEYILGVLKSEDELYVSKAIRRSTWLITDPHYAYIINPEYIYKELYPEMTTKAFNRLMLQIRLYLKDEKRVEAFYNYIKEKDGNSAYKWLQHCSVPFVEAVVAKYYQDIPNHLLSRLFEKSFTIFESYHKNCAWMINGSRSLLKNHTDKYLDFIETSKDRNNINFTAKDTKFLMLKCPERIVDKFDLYANYLHMATFAKYLNKKENIKDFLMKYHNNDKCKSLFRYNNIQHFIRLMPKESRFEFVKKVLIDKDTTESCDDIELCDEIQVQCCMAYSSPHNSNTSMYQWYKFAPFEVAFPDLKKLIRTESAPDQRTLILQVLLTCAGRNMQHIRTVLQYYYDKHINEPFKFKINFVNSFISKVDTHSLDDQTWGLLSQLFHSMEVFIESENNVQSCIKAIIVRNVIRNELVPDIIKKKFVFDTLNTYNKKLKKQEEKNAVFKYLQDFLTTKINSLNLNVESEFDEALTLCEQLFKLIKDWNKELHDFPNAIARAKELIKVKKEKQWSKDFTTLYNIKKSWRKEMFEESLALMQNEAVCMNALKHDPSLLSRNKELMMAMCRNDSVSLRRLLRKIRIYWPHSLTEYWKTEYLKHLSQNDGHKAAIDGLCALLPQDPLNELLKKYAPSNTKINWNETDQLDLSLRKQIAKNIYKARPLPPIEGILLYAKGDYLQFAVPSLNSVLNQLSPNKSRHYVPTLLDAPVSLQKFGVRCAFRKLTFEELKPMLFDIWTSTKNTSIRAVLFTQTFEMLCKEKNDARVKMIWHLLSIFIDNLAADENKLVYTKLGEVSKVPDSVKPEFYMKSYTFLNSLPAKCNCESILLRMQRSADNFMDALDNDFVVNIMLKKIDETFCKKDYIYDDANVIAKFILASKVEDTQMKRFEMSLAPILEKYLPQWDSIVRDSVGQEGKYRVKTHIKQILITLAENLLYTIENKMQMPSKIFEVIQSTMEKSLSYEKEYVLLTTWKLVVNLVKSIAETEMIKLHYKIKATDKDKDKSDKKGEEDKLYTEIHKEIRPQFAKTCVQYLKKDLDRFGDSVYLLFAQALDTLFYEYLSDSISKMGEQLEYGLWLLRNENDKYIWLVVQRYLKKRAYRIYSDEDKKKFEEVREIVLSSSCPVDVKMHYYDMFSNMVPFTPSTS